MMPLVLTIGLTDFIGLALAEYAWLLADLKSAMPGIVSLIFLYCGFPFTLFLVYPTFLVYGSGILAVCIMDELCTLPLIIFLGPCIIVPILLG